MKKGIKISFAILLMAMPNAYAQTLDEAIELTVNEQYEQAGAAFQKLIAAAPTGKEYFFYGENFFKNDNVNQAKAMYKKGAELDPENAFPIVGMGKIKYIKGDVAGAKVEFEKAIDMTKGKNPEILMEIASVYIYSEKKDIAQAFALLEEAKYRASENSNFYILMGDAYLEQNNGSKAIVYYEKAEHLDTNFVLAILRQGQLYLRARNYNLALDLFKKVSLKDPNFAPAYREKAELYAKAEQFGNAVEQYQKYLELNDDCVAKSRYAGYLFQAKDYQKSIEAAKAAQTCNPKNAYLFRYLAYSQCELKQYDASLKNSTAFFENKNDKIEIIAMDYQYMAKAYDELGQDSLAVINYYKAMEVDTTVDFTREIATLYMKSKDFKKAAEVYKKAVENGKKDINTVFGLGRAYYYSEEFGKADTAFMTMVEMRPELALSYLWRAKANTHLDPKNETWQAKAFYEEYIKKTTPENVERDKRNLVSAHTYLAAYYASQKDMESTKAQFEEILKIDPENGQAKKFLEAIKK